MSELFNLNNGDKLPDCTGKEHDYVVIQKPKGNRSGYHEKECLVCGIRVGWDDSD